MTDELIAAIGGAIVGACLTWFCSVRLRDADKWKLFQEEVGKTKSKFLTFQRKRGIEGVAGLHRSCLNDLTSAVCCVRPYIFWSCNRARLMILLDDYRTADQKENTGFLPADLAGNYKDRPSNLFCDPEKAINYLIGILKEMDGL